MGSPILRRHFIFRLLEFSRDAGDADDADAADVDPDGVRQYIKDRPDAD